LKIIPFYASANRFLFFLTGHIDTSCNNLPLAWHLHCKKVTAFVHNFVHRKPLTGGIAMISSVILSPKRWSNTKFFTMNFTLKPSSLPGGVHVTTFRLVDVFKPLFEISACFLATDSSGAIHHSFCLLLAASWSSIMGKALASGDCIGENQFRFL
jgi:hypothetical protein